MAKKSKKSVKKQHKKRQTQKPEFFESLPASMPILPQIMPAFDTSAEKPLPQFDAQKAREAAELVWGDAKALGADIAHYAAIVARVAVSRPARRIYMALATAGIVVGGTATLMFIDSTYALYASDLSNPAVLLTKKNTGTTLLDRNGKVLYQVYGANTRVMVDFSQTPKTLIDATLAAEDAEFYNHPGISWKGTARALYQDVIHGGAVEGGSTLTQQLIKNTLLTPNRSITRKAQEITLATELEHRYSKDKILELYLNGVYYGQGSYGIGTAAQTYFKKDIKNLTLGESAMLAGLPLGPSRFDPVINPDVAHQRRDYVLDRMQTLGFITAAQASTAKQEPINANARQIEIQAPHFVFYVLEQLRAKYGDDKVEHGGLTVYTSLDLDKQKIGEDVVKTQIAKLAGRHVTDGALVSLDPKTGEILAMVGSVDYNNPSFGAVNITTSERQPGSSIKPLVYLDAFSKGWTPATTVDDLPVSFPDVVNGPYKPLDYDKKFRGKVTLRRALSNSLNIPAVHVLEYVTIPDALNYMHTLGITTLNDPSRYGLSLVLGGGEVKMVDMATAYGVFANQGAKVTPVTIRQVLDRTGKDITQPNPKTSQQIADPRNVYQLTSILSDNNARKEEFGLNSPLHLSRPAAAKTGTTTDFKDNWTAGYTPDVVTVAWAGNADNTPMGNVDGVTGAAPIWHDYMEAILAGTPVHNFTQPSGMSTAKVCISDGGLANPWDTSAVEEAFLTEALPKKHCVSTPPPPPTPAPAPSDTQPKPDMPPTPTPPIPPTPPTPTPPPIDCKPFKCNQQ